MNVKKMRAPVIEELEFYYYYTCIIIRYAATIEQEASSTFNHNTVA